MGIWADRRRRREHLEIIAKVEKALPQFGGALVPASGGRPAGVDLSSIAARMAIGGVATVTNITPEAIVEALTAQGLSAELPFSPGKPLEPYAGYDGDARLFNYTVGQNISTRPRTNRIPFETLKGIIDAYDVAQICIRHLINDVRTLPVLFKPLDGTKDDVSADIAAARAFWRKPDKRLPYKAWVAKLLNEVLRYDAGVLYRQRTRDGSLHALKVVSGPTIAPLIDYYGDIPEPPAPAYSQFVNGVPWKWFTTDDLLYIPQNPQADSVYGLAPIEGVLLTANTDVRFQWHFLNYFTEGTVPEGFMEAPPDLDSPEQIEKWQATWDAFMQGDQAVKHQIRWVPHDANYTATKDTQFDEKFPLYLMRRTTAAFGVTPNDLGFTESVNRATGDTQIDVQWRVGTKPLVGWLEDIMNEVTQVDLGLQVEMKLDAGQEKEDRLVEAQAHQIYCMIGAEGPDEVRESVLGLPVNPAEMVPRTITTRNGLVPIKNLLEIAGTIDTETGAPAAGTVTPIETTGYQVPMSVPPPAGTNAHQAALAAEDAPLALPVGAPVAKAYADEDDEPDPIVLRQWRANARTQVKKGLTPRRFPDLQGPLVDEIWSRLEHATDYAAIDAAFEASRDPFVQL